MATRTLIIDFKRGTGDEPFYGHVLVRRTKATENGTIEILPWETKMPLRDGIATLTDAVTDGSGPIYDSGYQIIAVGSCGQRAGVLVALPDGSTPIHLSELPKVQLITGDGSYLDIDQLNEMIQQAMDTAQSVRDDADAGKFNGDPGNATMRVDTTVGTRVFITDGTTEHLVSGETGEIDISALLASGVTADSITMARTGRMVTLSVLKLKVTTSGSQNIFTSFPTGFRPTRMQEMRIPVTVGTGSIARLVQVNGPNTWYSGASNSDAISFQVAYYTADSWPTATPPNSLTFRTGWTGQASVAKLSDGYVLFEMTALDTTQGVQGQSPFAVSGEYSPAVNANVLLEYTDGSTEKKSISATTGQIYPTVGKILAKPVRLLYSPKTA